MGSILEERATTAQVVIQPSRSLFQLDLAAVWEYRELLYFFIWRDVKVRYKQTAIGAAWAIIQPLVTMVIFTVIFGNFAQIPSDGFPYSVFAYTALLPWNYFSQALSRGGTSLVSNGNLISKVYFPRLIILLAANGAPVVDFFPALITLFGLMIWFGIWPTIGIFALPLFMFLAFLCAFTVSLWLAPLNVRYRDVGHALTFLIQVWMYASPVVYPVSIVPERWRLFYGLNPMTGVIEGFRWALLGNAAPDFTVMGASILVILALLLGGIIYFKHMEKTFADVV